MPLRVRLNGKLGSTRGGLEHGLSFRHLGSQGFQISTGSFGLEPPKLGTQCRASRAPELGDVGSPIHEFLQACQGLGSVRFLGSGGLCLDDHDSFRCDPLVGNCSESLLDVVWK